MLKLPPVLGYGDKTPYNACRGVYMLSLQVSCGFDMGVCDTSIPFFNYTKYINPHIYNDRSVRFTDPRFVMINHYNSRSGSYMINHYISKHKYISLFMDQVHILSDIYPLQDSTGGVVV